LSSCDKLRNHRVYAKGAIEYILCIHSIQIRGYWIMDKDKTDKKEPVAAGMGTEYDRYFHTLFENVPIGMSIWATRTGKIYEANEAYCKILGMDEESLRAYNSWKDFTHPEDIHRNVDYLKDMLDGKTDSFSMDKRFYNQKTGEIIWAEMTCAFFGYDKNGEHLHICILNDVTERVNFQKRLRDISITDEMTGLKNRRYFEERIEDLDNKGYLPVSVVVGDVNGLKLTNDTFGHLTGDKLLENTARVMTDNFNSAEVSVCRIGGDEFVALMPHTEEKAARAMISAAEEDMKSLDIAEGLECSIALGYAIKDDESSGLIRAFQAAEHDMYNEKIKHNASIKKEAISIIVETLNEKEPKEREHCSRVREYSVRLGRAIGMTDAELKELGTAAMLHDIGKIGVSDEVLSKEGRLSEEEYEEVKRHAEIGYKLLHGITEFTALSESVLSHHERIDGNGYPRRLSGKEIPLQARIISLADAYDAITNDRTYKKKKNREEAIEELRQCAGLQFDKDIVDVFIDKVISQK